MCCCCIVSHTVPNVVALLTSCAQPQAWAAVYYLLRGLPDELRARFCTVVEPALSRGTVTCANFIETLFGANADPNVIDASARAWLATLASRTWKIVWINWDERAPEGTGSKWLLHSPAADWWSLIVTHRPVSQMSVRFECTASENAVAAAALVVGFVSATDFFLIHRPFKRDVLMLQHFEVECDFVAFG